MSSQVNFVSRVLQGEVFDPLEEIDDAIDEWHAGGSGVPLSDWLGLTPEEYALFVEQPSQLRTILKARKYGQQIVEIARSSASIQLAARGLEEGEVENVVAWLRRTNRI